MNRVSLLCVALLLPVGCSVSFERNDWESYEGPGAEYFQKEEATLDGDEAWTRVTQTAASTVTDADWDDANEVLVAFSVSADELSDGYEWVSVDVADPGTAHVGCVFAVASSLRVQRAPANLPQPNA
jgi:hypothetical protein